MFTFTIDRLNMLERDDIFAFTTAAYIFSSPNNSEHLKIIVTFVTSLQQLNSNQTAILPAIFFLPADNSAFMYKKCWSCSVPFCRNENSNLCKSIMVKKCLLLTKIQSNSLQTQTSLKHHNQRRNYLLLKWW